MKVLPFIPLLVLVAACSNDPDHPAPAPQEQGEKITLTAALGGGNVQTRIDYDDSDEPGAGVRLTWTADDAFLAYTADGKRSLFTLSEGAESDRGTFTGTAPDATNKSSTSFTPPCTPIRMPPTRNYTPPSPDRRRQATSRWST